MKKIILTCLFGIAVLIGFSQPEYLNHFAFGGKGTSLATNSASVQTIAMCLNKGYIAQIIGISSDTVDIDPSANEFLVNPADGRYSVLKTDTAGNFVCAFQISGSGGQLEISDIALDTSSSIYISGYVISNGSNAVYDLNPGAGFAFLSPAANEALLFIAKYSPTGTFQWMKQFDDSQSLGATYPKIRLTPIGNILLAGSLGTAAVPDFDNGPGVSSGGNGVGNTMNMFVVEYTPSGSYVQSIYWGATTTNEFAVISDIALRPNGNIALMAFGTTNVVIDPNSSAASILPTMGFFVMELDNNLSYIGGGEILSGNIFWAPQDRIKVANDGGIAVSKYVLAGTYDIDPTANVNSVTLAQQANIIMKFSSLGNYQTSFAMDAAGGSSYSPNIDLAFNPYNELFLYGNFFGSLDLDPGSGVTMVTAPPPFDDYYISKFSPQGNFIYGFAFGDNSRQPFSLIAISETDIYLYGQGTGFDLDFSSNTAMFDYQADDGKAYVAKYRECPSMTNNVIASGTILTAAQSGAQYQWYDCNGSTPLSGETSQSYIATANGDYYVEATIGSCTVVSNCVNVSGIGIAENNTNKQIKLYPNPSSGNVNIVMPDNDIASIEVINLLGQTVKTISNPTGTIVLQLENEGQYIIRVTTENSVRTHHKLIVKK